jgi:hypothetical protein
VQNHDIPNGKEILSLDELRVSQCSRVYLEQVIVLRNLTNDPFEFATVLFPEVEFHGSVTFLATASFHEARKVLHFRHWFFPKCIDFAVFEESDSVAKPVSPSDSQSGTF